MGFIMTKAQPSIFYFPNETTGRIKRSHISSKQRIRDIIENSKESINATNREIDYDIELIYHPVQAKVSKESPMRYTTTDKNQEDVDLKGNEPAENVNLSIEDMTVEVEKKSIVDEDKVSKDKEIVSDNKSDSSDEESGGEVENSEVEYKSESFVEKESENVVEKSTQAVKDTKNETEIEKVQKIMKVIQ